MTQRILINKNFFIMLVVFMMAIPFGCMAQKNRLVPKINQELWSSDYQIPVETILPPLFVHRDGDKNVFATPFDYSEGTIVTAHVETPQGEINNVNLETIIRKGFRLANGDWKWEKHLIENRTILDTWHAQASTAIDKNGYIHVAYNMHNMPWQYSVSEHPYDIRKLNFRGEYITQDDIETVKFQNRTPFPYEGVADIPGTQVTYPMFFKDNDGELYITYRFATKPARKWKERGFAGGIAKYDVISKTWRQLGGDVLVTDEDALGTAGSIKPFVFDAGYVPYLITLGFDSENGIHAFWNWRAGGAGGDTEMPSYAFSPDGENFFAADGGQYLMPIDVVQSDVVDSSGRKFYATKSVDVLPSGEPIAINHHIGGMRELVVWDEISKQWSAPSPMPYSASEVVVDETGRIWAFASGLRVFMKERINEPWNNIGKIGSDLCSPKVKYFDEESIFIIHAKTCDGNQATIVSFEL